MPQADWACFETTPPADRACRRATLQTDRMLLHATATLALHSTLAFADQILDFRNGEKGMAGS